MIAKLATALTSGITITLALLYGMQSLIRMQPGVVSEPPPRFAIDWRYEPPREDPPDVIDHSPKSLPPIDYPTHTPPPDTDFSPGTGVRPPSTPVPVPDSDWQPPGHVMNDGPLVAIVRVAPEYPAGPLRQGLEGYVDLEFDVLANGSVANVRVLESTHRGFDRPAIKAVERFRYKARVVDGIPRISTGVRTRVRFRLDGG